MHRSALAMSAALLLLPLTSVVVGAQTGPSGQRHFGQATVEPAYDDMTGNLIYLLTPNNSPFPSKANSTASAPMYLVVYPTSSTVSPLNCTPTNCDHVQSLPPPLLMALGLTSVYPGGVVKGHDHLVGVAKSGGDFNVAWHVYLVLFTPKAVGDGAINTELVTKAAVDLAIANGDAVGPLDIPPPEGPVVFNCSIVSAATYNR